MSESWLPRFSITPSIASALMRIEAARAAIDHAPLTPVVEARLRERARLRSTHYSTFIEGNRLTLAETGEAIQRRGVTFHGRERDVAEVRNYWNALIRIEEWAAKRRPLTDQLIQRLHAMVEYGPRAKPTPYRDGQNSIRDAATGALVYLPPEARDVPGLMAQLIDWAHHTAELPIPLIAGLLHYQFVTIHPFYDGNGRTARLLATFILHRGGYGLHGFFSLEEHHARDLDAYYRALMVHPHHNYYMGRREADLTTWLEYFIDTLARVFTIAMEEAQSGSGEDIPSRDNARKLDHRARTVLALFAERDTITSTDVANALGLSTREARNLLSRWVAEGLLEMTSTAKKNRAYRLTAI